MIDSFQKQVEQTTQLMIQGQEHAQQGNAQATESGVALQLSLLSVTKSAI